MARFVFNTEMEEHLMHIIRNGEDGNIYRCLVLRSDNQKLKVRYAWNWVHGNSYHIIVAEWEYLFIHSSPTHTAAAVKAKAANWDVWRHLLYGTKNFFLAKRLENCLVSSFERRDETFGDEFYGSASEVLKLFYELEMREFVKNWRKRLFIPSIY